MSAKKIEDGYWENLYQSNEIGWDIGYASPPLANYIDQLKDKSLNILIPGCGNGYEIQYLLDRGFANITVIDIAPTLTEALTARFKSNSSDRLKIITGDFFELHGKFDLILEQTFLSALDLDLRKAYPGKLFELLVPAGKVVGVLFNKIFDEEGPPFGGNKAIYMDLFKAYFNIIAMEPCYNSIDRRAGNELFINLERKS